MNFTKRDSWYRTDWIFPTLSLPGQPLGICAIDLEFTFQESKDGEGILTCFFGMPSLDPFGDADKSKLPSQKIHVTLRKPAGTTLGLPTESFEVYFITAVDTKYIEATLVLNFENPETSRMIVYTVGDNSRTVSRKERVLPLLSERLQRLAEQTAKTDLANVRLYSGQIDNKNAILIEGKNGICTYQHDRNSCSLDWLGFPGMSTCIYYGNTKVSFVDLNVPDSTGQERRVYQCVKRSVRRNSLPICDQEPEFEIQILGNLILHPRVGGWHRFISLKDGQMELFAPMHWLPPLVRTVHDQGA